MSPSAPQLRDCLDLLAWQLAAPPAPAADPLADQAALDAFFTIWAERAGVRLGEREQAPCQRVVAALLAQAALPPRVALRGAVPREGALSHDLAALLRPPQQVLDEADELDLAVRYWEAARKAGLMDEALAADFGEFWRRVEWSGLQQHLAWLAQGQGDEARLLAQVVKVVSRYAELAPLKRLLEAARPALFDAGFSLR